MQIKLVLPWPPSANTYWRRNGHRYFISPNGKKYRDEVINSCAIYANLFDENARINVHVDAYPPDKRRRDLDNLGKSLLDSLQAALIFPDDSQIDRLCFVRMPTNENKVEVYIERINPVTTLY
jgi:crossover junction endodeoxyribonuclease RusA